MKMSERVMGELQRMGLSPKQTERGVLFTYRDADYLLYEFEMEEYLFFMTKIAEAEESDLTECLKTVNAVNRDLHFAKLVVDKGYVWGMYEYILTDKDKLEFVLMNALSTLSGARQEFHDRR